MPVTRARDERGFTLVEVLISATLGIVVLFGAGALLHAATMGQKATSERIEAVQRGRLVLDLITQQLRSQICIGQGRPALVSGTGDEVVFHASLAGAPTTSGQLQIDRRTLRFEPAAGTPDTGRIVEEVRTGTGTVPDLVFPVAPSRQRVLVDRVSRAAPGAPIFRYERYDPSRVPAVGFLEQATPLTAADLPLTVRVGVAFDSHPDAGQNARRSTKYADQVLSRNADPADPTRSACA